MPVGHYTYKLLHYQKCSEFETLYEEYQTYERNCDNPCKLQVLYIRNATFAWQEREFNKCLDQKNCNKDVLGNCQKIAGLNIKPGIDHTNTIAYSCFLGINKAGLTREFCSRLSDYEQDTCHNIADENLALQTADYSLCPNAVCRVDIAIRNKDIQRCHELVEQQLEETGAYQALRCFYEVNKDTIDLELCDRLAEKTGNFTLHSSYIGNEIRNGCYAFAYDKKARETGDISYCHKIHDNIESSFVSAYLLRRECIAYLSQNAE